jgi:hypothetical protein
MRHTTETFPTADLQRLLDAAHVVVHLHDTGNLRQQPNHCLAIEFLRTLTFTPDPPPKSGVTIDHSGFYV